MKIRLVPRRSCPVRIVLPATPVAFRSTLSLSSNPLRWARPCALAFALALLSAACTTDDQEVTSDLSSSSTPPETDAEVDVDSHKSKPPGAETEEPEPASPPPESDAAIVEDDSLLGELDAGMRPTPDAPAPICQSRVEPYEVPADAVVGDGTPESCTEEALRGAVAYGGVVKFDCGASPVIVPIQAAIALRTDLDTIVDGAGAITLDAQHADRHFVIQSPDWQSHDHKVVLQGLTLIRGKAPAGEFFPPQDNPDCAYGYKEGSGGAVFMRDGNLEVIDCVFVDNEAALLGPDVGGGAIYAVGSRRLTISGSQFIRNRAANGGAIGALHTTLDIFNSTFEHNRAEGHGLNFRVPEEGRCPAFNHDSQGGAGGLAGAVYADGLDASAHVFTICGTRFIDNRANEMGGALFRTPNRERREMRIDRCTFADNSADMGGVSFIKDNHVVVRDSVFHGNRGGIDVAGDPTGGDLGGLWINRGTVDVQNSTFHDNLPAGLIVDNRATPGDDRPPSAGPAEAGEVANTTFSESAVVGNLFVRNSIFVDTGCEQEVRGELNLQWPTTAAACVPDARYADPELSPLDDYGGPTWTMPPSDDADVLFGNACPEADQRGRPRARCAVGAVEP